jgi:hypothetical protein
MKVFTRPRPNETLLPCGGIEAAFLNPSLDKAPVLDLLAYQRIVAKG